MAKHKHQQVQISVAHPTLEELSGTIVHEDSHSIAIQHKKPRSSKQQVTTIPMRDVAVVQTNAEDDSHTVLYRTQKSIFHTVAGDLASSEDGFLTINDEDGNVHRVNMEFGVAEPLDLEDEAPAKKAPAKKAAAPAKKGKKVVEDDEEEDEEEEEEEAPKKKGAPAKKGKKVVEEDDEDWA